MGPLFAELFLLGLLSGLDPLAFVAVLVVSAQNRRNGVAFVAGWLLVLLVLTLAPAIFIHGDGGRRGEVTHRHLRAWLFIALGVVLIVLALRAYQLGRRHDPDSAAPRWYKRLQRVGPKSSFFAGCALPSFPAALAAGAAVFHTDIRPSGKLVAVIVFLLVSSAIVIVPPALLYLHPEVEPRLARINDWAFIRRHNITFVVLGVIGLFLIARSTFRLIHGV